MLAGSSGSSKTGVLPTAPVWLGCGELGAVATCGIGAKGLSSMVGGGFHYIRWGFQRSVGTQKSHRHLWDRSWLR